MKKGILALLGLLLGMAAHAQSFEQYVVAYDVIARPIAGELRFCERANLRDGVCGQNVSFFGKKRFMVQDWWSPSTYVAAVTGLTQFEVTNIEPTGDGRGIVIYYAM